MLDELLEIILKFKQILKHDMIPILTISFGKGPKIF